MDWTKIEANGKTTWTRTVEGGIVQTIEVDSSDVGVVMRLRGIRADAPTPTYEELVQDLNEQLGTS